MKSTTENKIVHEEIHPHFDSSDENQIDTNKIKVVLAGNPNVGKSLFFNYLSGMYVDVSNFPGTTVSITKGEFKDYEIYDTPGVYGVSSFNDEEKVARDVILGADIILNVVNSVYLERDLFLTLQLIQMGKKVTVLLNFCDELDKRKIRIDTARLSELLGVEIIETSALNKKGFDKLEYAIQNASEGSQPQELHHLLHETLNKVGSQAEALLILEGDEYIAKKHEIKLELLRKKERTDKDENFHARGHHHIVHHKDRPHERKSNRLEGLNYTNYLREKIYIERRNHVNEIVNEVEFEDSRKGKLLNKFGKYCLHPITGIPILLVVLTLVYFFIGDFVSQRIVPYTENTLGKNEFEYHVKSLVSKYTPVKIEVSNLDDNDKLIEQKIFEFKNGLDTEPLLKKEFKNLSSHTNSKSDFYFYNPFIRLFFGQFGIVTMTITYLFFLLLPLVASFYFVMALLEDSGYLPRLATMLDRSFNKIGLNGRAVIPIMLGFGCVTMATITTRLLGTEREKTITTAILQFVIPCSAQLAVISVMMSTVGLIPFLIYVATIFSTLIILSTVLNKSLPGESSPLLIDLPSIHIPKLDNILKKMIYRTYGFMKEASFWFFIGALAVGVMDISGMLTIWQKILEPFTTIWLKLPKETANAFIMGMVRRDFGAAGLFHLQLTPMQTTVAITTITLFVPCIASFVIMLKERGWKQGLSIWAGTWFFAFFIGGIVAQIFI